MSHTTYHQYKLDIKVPLKESFKTKRSKLDLNKGEKVYYIGKHLNGPKFGSLGTVKNTLSNLAIIDLGANRSWKIPYFYLQSLNNLKL